MPPGAKKKHKAAKRKKKQERRQPLGSQHSGSADCPSADHPHHLQEGNGEGGDDVDLTTQENKGCESVGKLDLHAAGENALHRLEVEAEEEQAESSVEDKGNKKESETSVAVHFAGVMEGTNNGALDQTISESLVPQKADIEISNEVETEVPAAQAGGLGDDASLSSKISDSAPTISSEVPIPKVEEDNEHIQSENKLGADVPAAQAGGLNDDVSLSSISDSAPAISSEIPISMIEEGTEHIHSERGKEVAIHEGHKESSSLKISGPDEPVPVSAWVLQPSAVSIETVEVIERAAEGASTKDQVKLVPPTNTTNQQQDPDSCDKESTEIAGTAEVARPTHLQQRTSWMNCCGIFDVLTGDTR